MYNRTFWLDHVTDQNGQVIQQGTLLDQAHHNNMENGISDASIALAILQMKQNQDGYENEAEVHSVALGMNSYPWPFNNKETTVALNVLHETANYNVDVYVNSYSGGELGNIRVKDKAVNGFKLLHDGSATTVNVTVRITGGMLK